MTSPINEALGPYLELLALMRPGARFVLTRGMGLGWAKKVFEAALLEEARVEGLGLLALAKRLGFGASKAFSLGRLRHRELPQSCLPAPLGLDDLIEAMLWLGPLTPAKLNQFLPEFKYAEMTDQIQALLAAGRLMKAHGLLHVPRGAKEVATHRFFETLSQALASPQARHSFTLPRATLEQWLRDAGQLVAPQEGEGGSDQVEVCVTWMDSHA